MSSQPLNVRNRYAAQFEFVRGVVEPSSVPTSLQIGLDNRCNFHCVYCTDHRAGNEVPRTALEGSALEEMLALVPRVETLAFHGISEFFLDRRFFEIVERCAAAGATLSLNTNGSVATERHLAALRDYPGALEINFSIDAATAPTFRRVRGWDFDRVVGNVRAYLDALRPRRPPTWTSTSFVILRSNVEEMEAFVRLSKELGVGLVKFYRLHEYGILSWTIEAPDGRPFDYREECTDRFAELHDEHVRRAGALAAELGLRIEIPATYAGDVGGGT